MHGTLFRKRPLTGLLIGLPLLALALYGSIALGLTETRFTDIVAAFAGPSEHPAQIVIRTVRIPRAVIAAGVGSALAVAGALMQALTRNPLASPGILGVNAGGALFVVVALFLLKSSSLSAFAWAAFLGAGLAGALVYALGSLGRAGMTPVKLTVAGAAMTALLTSMTQGLLVLQERTLDEVRFWLAGSVAGRDLELFYQVAPYLLIGLATAMLLGRSVTLLSLGEDVAKGLGQRTARVKALVAIAVVLLAGSSVAVAGPIAFIGLAVPHLARGLVGPDYRWVIPYSAVLGAILLLVADVGARFIIRPEEVPVGVMTALLGAPFFLYLARSEGRRA